MTPGRYTIGITVHMRSGTEPLINECVLCTKCSATFRVLRTSGGGDSPHLDLVETNDRESIAQVQLSHCPCCPCCMPGSGEIATAMRPAVSRLRMREVIVELLGHLERDAAERDHEPMIARIADIRAELGLAAP